MKNHLNVSPLLMLLRNQKIKEMNQLHLLFISYLVDDNMYTLVVNNSSSCGCDKVAGFRV